MKPIAGSDRNLRDESDAEIQRLVESLNSLQEGELGISLLVARGERAVGPLRHFLLRGKASSIFVPRQRAVRALAELGAKQVLLEYLAAEKFTADPVIRQGEEAVENTAARALAAWQSDEIYEVLLRKFCVHCLPGVIETLGEFRRPEPLAGYIAALEDDVCRISAEEAIRKLGEEARLALVEAARTPDPSGTHESPSSICRRRSALRLVSALRLSGEDWHKVASLLRDRDAEIVARAACIALTVANARDQSVAIRRLIEVLPSAHWLLQGEVEAVLCEHYAIAQAAIDREIARRQAAMRARQSTDNILRLLLGVRRKAEELLAEAHSLDRARKKLRPDSSSEMVEDRLKRS